MASCGQWLVAFSLLTAMAGWVRVNSQGVQWSDERAGQHLDFLTEKGIQLALSWYHLYTGRIQNMNTTMNVVQNLLNVNYSEENLPNITAYVEAGLDSFNARLDEAETRINDMGLNNTDDGLATYFKTPTSTVNIGGHFSWDNGGRFIVPIRGLYQILIRNKPQYNFDSYVSRNGNETIISLSSNNYYDVRTRFKLIWLNPGDQIYTTGDTPHYFGVTLLRYQTLMPDFL